ncbi:MAG: hypothetical protein ACREJN_18240, partial [Nitrospiraceae bacterium]
MSDTANTATYKKYSAPSATDTVVEYEVGLEEQHQPPDACPNEFMYTDYFGFAGVWVPGGTATAPTDTVRIADTAVDILMDPASDIASIRNARASVVVGTTDEYQIGMIVDVGGRPAEIQDIYPAVNDGTAITIQSIFYFTGTTGYCVIVPTQGPTPTPFQTSGPPPSLYSPGPLAALRRGSVVNLDNGVSNEDVFVLNVAIGPNGTICFETVTVATYAATNNITGIAAVCMSNVTTANIGNAINSRDISYTQTAAGIGTVSENLGAIRPFNFLGPDNESTTQQYDYVGFSINISDLSKLVAVTFIFNIDPSVTFDTNGFYAQLLPGDLVLHPTATSTLPVSQYTSVLIPITSLKRFGADFTKTLTDANGIQIKIETTAAISVRAAPFWIGIGHQPDVGPTGAPYGYAVCTRNTTTGVKSNPSPVTRYQVGPRRQSVRITMTDTNTDPQDNVWDVFRVGGSVSSMRYIGSVPLTGGLDIFIDDYFDTAAQGGSLIEYDNFQPWPTIDVPYIATVGTVAGITTDITVTGTVVIITYSAAAPFTDPAPATILRWLPGTLLQIDGRNAYTLWNRPTLVTLAAPPAADYFAYMFRLVENAGAVSPSTITINEPNVAKQILPYLWGPDATGTMFGCGDPLRAGSLYFSKTYNPDSAPDSYNQELTNPSEPLLGGDIANGISMTGSSKRWWALYPNFGSGLRFQATERPVKRGIAAPLAKCTDGKDIYFVAHDGIWTTEGQCLTDADLFNIFPHDGVAGTDYVYGG